MSEVTSTSKDLQLFRGQILPRARGLLLSWEAASAVVFGVGLASLVPFLPAASLPISAVVVYGFTFAAIAMGACISAIVLSLGLPGPDRLRRWSRMRGTTKGKSALSDLVFVLVWAALSQLGLVITCVLALAFGANLPLAPAGMSPSHAIALDLGITAFMYALFELFVVVLTLSQMGVVVIAEEQLAKTRRPRNIGRRRRPNRVTGSYRHPTTPT